MCLYVFICNYYEKHKRRWIDKFTRPLPSKHLICLKSTLETQDKGVKYVQS